MLVFSLSKTKFPLFKLFSWGLQTCALHKYLFPAPPSLILSSWFSSLFRLIYIIKKHTEYYQLLFGFFYMGTLPTAVLPCSLKNSPQGSHARDWPLWIPFLNLFLNRKIQKILQILTVWSFTIIYKTHKPHRFFIHKERWREFHLFLVICIYCILLPLTLWFNK